MRGLSRDSHKMLGASVLAISIAATFPSVSAAQETDIEETDYSDGEGADRAGQPEQSRSVTSLDQITVTAQRRNQSLQSVPIAVSAFTGETLRNVGLTDVSSLEAVVPGLSLSRGSSIVSPYIRGVGTNYVGLNVEPSVATYVDGIYVANGVAGYPFNNIERVEVLKGPQGTLFGRNATGGIIQIVTRDPTHEPEADFSVGYGNYHTTTSSAYAAGGLTQNLAADIAIYQKDQGKGFGRDLNTWEETGKRREFSARSKFLYTPGEDTEVRFAAGFSHSDGTPEIQKVAPGATGPNGATFPGRGRSEVSPIGYLEDSTWTASMRVDHNLSFASLATISAYSESERNMLIDSDSVVEHIVLSDTTGKMDNFSQEVQLLSHDGSALDWVLGAYFLDATYRYDPLQVLGSSIGELPFLNIFGTQNTRSYSIYGQGTYEVSPRLNATAGLRYTWEEQDIVSRQASSSFTQEFPKRSSSVEEPTWRLALDYQLTEDAMGYVSYNRGMKSGGYNIVSPGRPGFAPEILDAYEVGLKSTLFDNLLQLNLAAFYYDYKDMQVNIVEASVINIVNAAGARIRGADLDFRLAFSADFTLSGGIGYTDGEYTNYDDAAVYGPDPGPVIIIDAAGNSLPFAPKLTGNLMANYRIPSSIGDFVLNGSIVYNDGYYTEPSNRVTFPSYTLVNGTLAWNSPEERYAIEIWAKNLTDKYYPTMIVSSALGDKMVDAAPRTFGVTFRARF